MNNPYIPPESNLQVAAVFPARPSSVKWAIASAFLNLALLAFGVLRVRANSEFFLAEVMIVISVLFLLLFTILYSLWSGHNWARILYVLFLLVDTPSRISIAINISQGDILPSVSAAIMVILNLLTIYLLVKKSTNRWISALKSYRSRGL